MDVWQEKFPLRFESVDTGDRLTIGSAFTLLQEAAISHAEVLGVGRNALVEKGEGWALSRFSVFMERRPRYGENVSVESWPRGSEKLFALRDYSIKGGDGKSCLRGRASWLIIDIARRRPFRAGPIVEKLPLNEGRDAMPAGALSLPAREGLALAGKRRAAYSDIDYYGHMNNARYIQWIQDVADPALLTEASQIRLDINYISEVRLGELIDIWTGPVELMPEGAVLADYPEKVKAAIAFEGRRAENVAGRDAAAGEGASANAGVAFRAELRL